MTADQSNGSGDDDILRGLFKHGRKWRTRRPGSKQGWVRHEDAFVLAAWKRDARAAFKAGLPLPPEPESLGPLSAATSFLAFIEGPWMDKQEFRLKKGSLLPDTVKNRRDWIRWYIKPASWAHRPMSELTDYELTIWFRELDLSRNELSNVRWLVRSAFEMAVKYKAQTHVEYNLGKGLELPDRARLSRAHAGHMAARDRERHPATPLQIAQILERLHANDRLPFLLMYLMGLRIGEALGLPVGAWDPSRNRIDVFQQFGYHTRPESLGGGKGYIKSWTKSAAGERYLFVPPTFADFINSEIERQYGHSPARDDNGRFVDPWWDELLPEPPEKFIVRNRDLFVAVGPAGIEVWKGRDASVRQRIGRVADMLGVDLTLGDGEGEAGEGDVNPHDLRKTVSSLLASHEVSDGARAAFLGHAAKGTFEGSKVTAKHYTEATEREMRRIADLLEEHLVPTLTGLFSPPPLGDGPDRLVTVSEAAPLIGFAQPTLQRWLNASDVQPRLNPWGLGNWKYYRLGDLQALQPPRRPGLSLAEAGALLWPDEMDRGFARATLPERVRRLVNSGDLEAAQRTRRGASGLRVSAESVQRLTAIFERVRAAELLTAPEFTAATGVKSVRFALYGIEPIRVGGRLYVEASVLTAVRATVKTVSHMEARAALKVDEARYYALIRHLDPELTAPRMRVPATLLERMLAHRAELLAELDNPVVTVASKPRDDVWMPLHEAMTQLGANSMRVMQVRYRRLGWEVRQHDGVLYLRRCDVESATRNATDKEVPAVEVASRLDVSKEHVRTKCKSGAWAARQTPAGVLVNVDSVLEWLRAAEAAGDLLTVDATATRLGVNRAAVARALRGGQLRTAYRVRFGASGREGRFLFSRGEVERYQALTSVPEDWVTTVQAQELTGANAGAIQDGIKRGRLEARRNLRGKWMLSPAALEVLTRRAPEGFLTAAELLSRAGRAPTQDQLLQRRARKGRLPGAVKIGRQWHFPPELVTQLDELMPVDEIRSARASFVHQRINEMRGQVDPVAENTS